MVQHMLCNITEHGTLETAAWVLVHTVWREEQLDQRVIEE